MAPQVGTIPKTMRAWVAFGAGRIEDVLRLEADWPTPAPPRAGEVLIRVSYVAINPGDAKMIAKTIPFRKTCIAGMDFAGEVVQVGEGGSSASESPTALCVGMIVASTVPLSHILRGVGSLAEYLVVPAHAVIEKPDALDESAASGLLGIVGQTSVALLRAANLQKGDMVLVNGASGGVGSVLIQALHGIGVHVTGICSGKNVPLVRRLGAEEVRIYMPRRNLLLFSD
jgi:NADPH:quinone reductase-like Zn-dependent oxidoreductase